MFHAYIHTYVHTRHASSITISSHTLLAAAFSTCHMLLCAHISALHHLQPPLATTVHGRLLAARLSSCCSRRIYRCNAFRIFTTPHFCLVILLLLLIVTLHNCWNDLSIALRCQLTAIFALINELNISMPMRMALLCRTNGDAQSQCLSIEIAKCAATQLL